MYFLLLSHSPVSEEHHQLTQNGYYLQIGIPVTSPIPQVCHAQDLEEVYTIQSSTRTASSLTVAGPIFCFSSIGVT